MRDFLALYRGPSIDRARLITTTADRELVEEFVRRLLADPQLPERDPALRELELGKRRALEIVGGGASEA